MNNSINFHVWKPTRDRLDPCPTGDFLGKLDGLLKPGIFVSTSPAKQDQVDIFTLPLKDTKRDNLENEDAGTILEKIGYIIDPNALTYKDGDELHIDLGRTLVFYKTKDGRLVWGYRKGEIVDATTTRLETIIGNISKDQAENTATSSLETMIGNIGKAINNNFDGKFAISGWSIATQGNMRDILVKLPMAKDILQAIQRIVEGNTARDGGEALVVRSWIDNEFLKSGYSSAGSAINSSRFADLVPMDNDVVNLQSLSTQLDSNKYMHILTLSVFWDKRQKNISIKPQILVIFGDEKRTAGWKELTAEEFEKYTNNGT